MLHTDTITDTPQRYMRCVAKSWLQRWWWAVLLPPTILAALGVALNPIWFLPALMTVFLLYPGVLALLYINYALTPEARRQLYPHVVTLNTDGCLLVEYSEGRVRTDSYTPAAITMLHWSRGGVAFMVDAPPHHNIWMPVPDMPTARLITDWCNRHDICTA